MSAETKADYYRSPDKSNTEGLLILLQRDIRIVPNNSYLVTHGNTFGSQVIPTGILPEGQKLVASNEFTVHNPPIFHYDSEGNKISDSGYRINKHPTPDGKHIIFLAELGVKAKTSSHSHPTHPPVIEHYFLLYGNAFINGDPMNKRHVVHPGDEHQITTGDDSPALLLIFMENGGLVPEDMLHIPSVPSRG